MVGHSVDKKAAGSLRALEFPTAALLDRYERIVPRVVPLPSPPGLDRSFHHAAWGLQKYGFWTFDTLYGNWEVRMRQHPYWASSNEST